MDRNVMPFQEADRKRRDEDWGHLTWFCGKDFGNSDALTVGRVLIRKGKCNPRHYHPNCEEVLHLLSGRLEHTLGDESLILEAGDTITIPTGVVHNATSIGDGDADMIVTFSSAERKFVKVE